MKYKVDGDNVLFSQFGMPRMFFVALHQLDIYIHMLKNSWEFPYMVVMSESEFLSCVEMAKEL